MPTAAKKGASKAEKMAEMYFDQGMTQAEIAKMFKITPQSVSKQINKKEILDEYDERRKAHALRAKIRLAAATEKAVEVQMGYLTMELPVNLEYLRQNAARDILDRAGIKTEAVSEDNEIKITFATPFELGMPNMAEDVSEDDPDEYTN